MAEIDQGCGANPIISLPADCPNFLRRKGWSQYTLPVVCHRAKPARLNQSERPCLRHEGAETRLFSMQHDATRN